MIVEIQRLKSLHRELMLLDHNVTVRSSRDVIEIVESSENILEDVTGKINELFIKEQNWNLDEESKIIEEEFSREGGLKVPEELLLSLSERRGETSYPVKNSQGLRVSLHNAGIILRKIKQEKKVREKKYQTKGYESQTTSRQSRHSNVGPKSVNRTFTNLTYGAETEEATSQRYIDLVLIGFFVVILIAIAAVFSPVLMNRRKLKPRNSYTDLRQTR